MTMPPRLRKIVLVVHVACSVGWGGAVAAFLALAVSGLLSHNPEMTRAADLAMERMAWSVIVPLGLAALLSGLVQALGTPWGLFRHYWVLLKFVVTILATLLLLVHTQPMSRLVLAGAAASPSGHDLPALRLQLAADAAGALMALIAATALAVVKPRGLTRYGWRKRHAPPSRGQNAV